MKHALVLNYNLGDAALKPYLNGLLQGRACARRCARCGHTSFPPERRCRCESSDVASDLEWVNLSGQARIVHRTDGPGGSFALVHFAGADNQATCRIANPSNAAHGARLISAEDGVPGIMIEIGRENIEIDG